MFTRKIYRTRLGKFNVCWDAVQFPLLLRTCDIYYYIKLSLTTEQKYLFVLLYKAVRPE